jgi:hypothetical protein
MFAIQYGLMGLAGCWLEAGNSGLAPHAVGLGVTVAAMLVLGITLGGYVRGGCPKPWDPRVEPD